MGVLILVVLAAAGLLGCGPGAPAIDVLPGPGTARLQPIYDVSVTYPNTEIIISGLTYRGLELDLEMTFDGASLSDDDPAFEARARVTGHSAWISKVIRGTGSFYVSTLRSV